MYSFKRATVSTAYVLVLSSLLSFCATAAPPKQPALQSIKRCLQMEPDANVAVAEARRTDMIPFLSGTNDTVLVVKVNLPLAGKKESKATRTLFSEAGQFLRAESVEEISDPWRRKKDSLEKAILNSGDKITGVPRFERHVDIIALWEKVCQVLPMGEAKEYNLTLVEYQFRGKAPQAVFVLNVWGISNPLAMPDDLPEVLKNRVRVMLDLEGNVISKDNLL